MRKASQSRSETYNLVNGVGARAAVVCVASGDGMGTYTAESHHRPFNCRSPEPYSFGSCWKFLHEGTHLHGQPVSVLAEKISIGKHLLRTSPMVNSVSVLAGDFYTRVQT